MPEWVSIIVSLVLTFTLGGVFGFGLGVKLMDEDNDDRRNKHGRS